MKTNDVPKKIYLNPLLMEEGESICRECSFERLSDSQVEYIRKDAFIIKAVEWFIKIDYDDSMPPLETTEEFIEEFKKAMML